MKKHLIFLLLGFCLWIFSCEKETKRDAINQGNDYYLVKQFENSILNKEYLFNDSNLIGLRNYNANGTLKDTARFIYKGGLLDSVIIQKLDLNYTEDVVIWCDYNLNSQLTDINKVFKNGTHLHYHVEYDSLKIMTKVNMRYVSGPPFSYTFILDSTGNVVEVDNFLYYSSHTSLLNYKSEFDIEINLLRKFWVVETTNIFLSKNNIISELKTVSSVDYGMVLWDTSSVRNINFGYTYNEAGNMITKVLTDSNNAIVNRFDFDYSGF